MHETKIKRPGLSPALLILIPATPIKDIGTREKRSRPTVPSALDSLTRHGILHRPGVRNALRGLEDFQTHDVAVVVVVEDHPRLIFVTFRDGRVAQQNSEHVHLGIVGYFHGFPQYFSIFVVR